MSTEIDAMLDDLAESLEMAESPFVDPTLSKEENHDRVRNLVAIHCDFKALGVRHGNLFSSEQGLRYKDLDMKLKELFGVSVPAPENE